MLRARYDQMEFSAQERNAEMQTRARDRADARMADLEQSKALADHRERMAGIASNKTRPMDEFEKMEADWWKANPEAFGLYMQRKSNAVGRTAPMKPDAAARTLTTNQERLYEIDESLAVLDDQIDDWITNDVEITWNRRSVPVKSNQIQAVRDRLMRQKQILQDQNASLEHYTQTGDWHEPSELRRMSGAVTADPFAEDPVAEDFSKNYDTTPAQTGGNQAASNEPPVGSWDRVKWNATGRGPWPPSVMDGERGTGNQRVLAAGLGPDQRSPIPPPQEIARMSMLMQTFYQILKSKPEMNNREAKEEALAIMRQNSGMVDTWNQENAPTPSMVR
jgi:hypothetical protein